MAAYLVIDASRNVVFNSIEWDGISEHVPFGIDPSIVRIVQGEGAPGWLWDGAKAVDPNPQPPQESSTPIKAVSGGAVSAQIA